MSYLYEQPLLAQAHRAKTLNCLLCHPYNFWLAALVALRTHAEAHTQPVEDGHGVTFERSIFQLRRAVTQLREAKFVTNLLEKLNFAGVTKQARFRRFVVLGLGSPSNSTVARLQLSLAMILVEHLCLDASAMELYDPVFTPIDKKLLGSLDKVFQDIGECTLSPDLPLPRYRCKAMSPTLLTKEASDRYAGPEAAVTKDPTFWFMPHCEVDLYENVLKANWGSPSVLQSHICLGNNFETYAERWDRRHNHASCPHYILTAAKRLCLKIQIEGSSSQIETAAFGDTSVQIVGLR